MELVLVLVLVDNNPRPVLLQSPPLVRPEQLPGKECPLLPTVLTTLLASGTSDSCSTIMIVNHVCLYTRMTD